MENPVLHALHFRLAYSECDPAGIVYYGAYHPWMERTHTEWTYLAGVRTDRMMARWGVTTVSRHSSVSYERPALLFDPITCAMRLDRLGTTSLTTRYDFTHREDGGTLAVGTMTLVFVDRDRKPVPVPEPMRELLGVTPAGHGPPSTAPAAPS